MKLKKEDLKEGTFIHWVADRTFKAWNTYGKVVKVTGDEVTIVTFDDFKETTISLKGESIDDGEISLSDKQSCDDYLEERKIRVNTARAEADLEYKKRVRELDAKLAQLNNATI